MLKKRGAKIQPCGTLIFTKAIAPILVLCFLLIK